MPLERFNQGVNETADPTELGQGEMTACSGFWLKSGDERLHLINPSSAFSAAAASVQDLSLLPFDNGPDALVVRAGNSIYAEDVTDASPVLDTGNISPALTGLSGNRMVAAHYNDRWYLALGSSQRGKVLSSSGTLPLDSADWGVQAPITAPTLTEGSTVATFYRPTKVDVNLAGVFQDKDNIWDTDEDSFGYAALPDGFGATGCFIAGGSLAYGGGWDPDATGSERKINFVWSLDSVVGTVNIKIRYRDSAHGDAWITAIDSNYTSEQAKQTAQGSWDDDLAELHGNAEFSILCSVGSGGSALFKVYDIYIAGGSGSSEENFALGSGLLYAVSEYVDTTDQTSARGPIATMDAATFDDHNSVTVGLPDAAVNSDATHYKIWRTAEGGTQNTLGLLTTVPISETEYVDNFSVYDSNTQPPTAYPQLQVGATYYDRDIAPPSLNYVWHHAGALFGIDAADSRGIRSSIKGVPGSWPTIYYTPAIPQEEHDKLLAGASLGFTSVVATTGGMLRLLDVDRVTLGRIQQGHVDRIAGAPGCVGYRAFCVVPWKGVSSVAWVSPNHGICVTNGNQWRPFSDTIDWSKFDGQDKSGFVLLWDERRRCLVFAYDTAGGQNDSYYLGHVERKKGEGIVWTGPHTDAYTHRMAAANGSAGTFYLFGANDDTIKRLDDPDGTDSVSYSLTTGNRYGPDRRAYSMLDGRLRHTDFGTGASASLAYTVTRSPSGRSSTKTVTVGTAGVTADQFDISRSGESHQYTLSGSATTRGALTGIDWIGNLLGKEGKVSA